MTATRGVVTDVTPRVAVRCDDGSQEQILIFRNMYDAGITVDFSLNEGTLGTGSRMSADDVRGLLHYAERKGLNPQIINHSYQNWGLHGASYDDYTYAEIKAELDPSGLIDKFGNEHWSGVYMQPGDVGVNAWCQLNRHKLWRVMEEEFGYDFAIGLIDSASSTRGGIMMAPIHSRASSALDPAANRLYDNGIRPGMIYHPSEIPDESTIDLGNTVIPRGQYNATTAAWEPDLRSGAPAWALGEDNNGAGAEGDPDADWEKTTQFRIARYLGAGASFMLAMHGETRSDAANVVLSTGTTTYPGHFSSKHLAWVLSQLVELGHIKCVTVKEWCEHLYSDIPAGTDIVQNPDMRCPFLELPTASGQTRRLSDGTVYTYDNVKTRNVDADMPIATNLHTGYYGQTAYNEEAGVPTGLTQVASEVRIADVGSNTIRDIIGKEVVGIHQSGGLRLHADAGAEPSGWQVGWAGLSPGCWRVLTDVYTDTATNTLVVSGMAVVGARMYSQPSLNFQAGADDQAIRKVAMLQGRAGYRQVTLPADSSRTIEFEVDIPENPTPTLGVTHTWPAATAVGAGATVADTVTAAGARPGCKVVVVRHEAGTIPVGPPELTGWTEGILATGFCAVNDQIELQFHNITGSAIDPDGVDYHVYYEDLEWEDYLRSGIVYVPRGPWRWYIGCNFGKDGSSEFQVRNVRCIKMS